MCLFCLVLLGAFSSRALFVVTLSPCKFLLSHHPRLIYSRTCQDGLGFLPSSYQNQKFVHKKTVSAKDNLKCCILAGEGGKPGNEASLCLASSKGCGYSWTGGSLGTRLVYAWQVAKAVATVGQNQCIVY